MVVALRKTRLRWGGGLTRSQVTWIVALAGITEEKNRWLGGRVRCNGNVEADYAGWGERSKYGCTVATRFKRKDMRLKRQKFENQTR